MITFLNVSDHVTDHELILRLSYTDDMPQEALIIELSRHESRNQQAISWISPVMSRAAQLAIVKQLSMQISQGSAGNGQADEQAGIMHLRWQ